MLAQASKYQMSPASSSTPKGIEAGAIGADDIQQRAQRVQHQLRQHRDAEQCGAGLQKALTPARDGQHRPREQQRQRHAQRPCEPRSSRSDWAATGRPAPREAATAAATRHSKNTDAGSCAGDLRHRAISQNAFASRSIVRFGHNESSNCTRGSMVCPTRFGSIEATNCRRSRAPSNRIASYRPRYRIPARTHLLSKTVPAAIGGRR